MKSGSRRLSRAPSHLALLVLAAARSSDAASASEHDGGAAQLSPPRRLQVDDQPVSCSPLVFNVNLSLERKCGDSDLDDHAGIDETLCLLDTDFEIDEGDEGDEEARVFPARRRRLDQLDWRKGLGGYDGHHWRQAGGSDSDSDSDTVPVEITSIQFLEVDASGLLEVINQDNSFSDVGLADGDSVQFTSITSLLDPDVPLDDQLNLLPGGAGLILVGKNAAGESLRNRILWTYTNTCEDSDCVDSDLPIVEGKTIGWITFGNSVQGRQAFCSALDGADTNAPTAIPTGSFPPTDPPTTQSPVSAEPTAAPTPDEEPLTPPPTPCEDGSGEEESKSGKKIFKSKSSKSSSKSSKSSSKSSKSSSKSSKGGSKATKGGFEALLNSGFEPTTVKCDGKTAKSEAGNTVPTSESSDGKTTKSEAGNTVSTSGKSGKMMHNSAAKAEKSAKLLKAHKSGTLTSTDNSVPEEVERKSAERLIVPHKHANANELLLSNSRDR